MHLSHPMHALTRLAGNPVEINAILIHVVAKPARRCCALRSTQQSRWQKFAGLVSFLALLGGVSFNSCRSRDARQAASILVSERLLRQGSSTHMSSCEGFRPLEGGRLQKAKADGRGSGSVPPWKQTLHGREDPAQPQKVAARRWEADADPGI